MQPDQVILTNKRFELIQYQLDSALKEVEELKAKTPVLRVTHISETNACNVITKDVKYEYIKGNEPEIQQELDTFCGDMLEKATTRRDKAEKSSKFLEELCHKRHIELHEFKKGIRNQRRVLLEIEAEIVVQEAKKNDPPWFTIGVCTLIALQVANMLITQL